VLSIPVVIYGVNMTSTIRDRVFAVTHQKRTGKPRVARTRPTSYQSLVQSLPEDIQDKLSYSKKAYAKSTPIFKWIITYGNLVLNRQEAAVLLFIAGRTVVFGKKAEMITKDHFLHGIRNNNEIISSPCSVSVQNLYKSLTSLERLGFINVIPLSFRGRDLPTIYEIAIDFILQYVPSEEIMSKLKLPKALKGADIIDFEAYRREKHPKLGGSTRNLDTPFKVVPPGTTNIYKYKNEDYKDIVASASPRNENAKRVRRPARPNIAIDCKVDRVQDSKGRVRDVINITSTRVTLKQEEKVRRGRRAAIHKTTLQDMNATWKRCMVEKFGNCIVAGLTHKEYGMFKRIMKTHEVSCTFYDFATWAINNWQRLNKESKEFSDWRKRKDGEWSLKEEDRLFLGTDFPELFMLVKNYGKLVKRYAQESMNGKIVDTEEQLRKENETLKKKLKEKSFEADVAKNNLQRVAGQSAARKPRQTKPVKVVNPDGDTFFENADASLPEWK
jgi:hypothetical protein